MKVIQDFQAMKTANQKISMVTCYDYWSAQLINKTNIDCILVGDSAAMVMHGHHTTVPATIEMMLAHTEAVAKGAPDKFIIGDMPFLSYRKGLEAAVEAAGALIRAGANAVKLEGAAGNIALISHLAESGIPVMGHLGLTPQAIHQLSGWKVQGRDDSSAQRLMTDALSLEAAHCFALVLECVPSTLATDISEKLRIPTIGIGAGVGTDGQVLVLQDLLGFNPEFKPKLLKMYLNGAAMVEEALNAFNTEVKAQVFPAPEHSY